MLPFTAFSQQVEVVKFSFIESLLKNKSDTTFVINFWASWCKPCVKELPAFEELNLKNENKNIKVILISLNFKSELETKLKIVLLDEPDYNSWINKVNENWGGAIPATLIINYKNNVKQFYEKEFTFEELENKLNN
jgi:thiol-disulfide isomerase/thioredoxin